MSTDPEPAGINPFDPITGLGARGSLVPGAIKRLNLQPATTDAVDGWKVLNGTTTAGFAPDRTATTVDRDALSRPLYDTHTLLGTSTLAIALPNGSYPIAIMAGDSTSRAHTNHLMVNGTALRDPTPYDGNPMNGYEKGSFDGLTATVTVSNGTLSITSATDAMDAAVCFIEIGAVGATFDAATLTRIQAAAMEATQATALPKPALVKRNYWGVYVYELVAYDFSG